MADVDDQALARFMAEAHCSLDQAQFFLEACGGNHSRAIAMFYGALVWAGGFGRGLLAN